MKTAPAAPLPGPGARTPLRVLVSVLALLLAGACGGGGGKELPVLFDTPDFALTDQTGDTLRASRLRGQAWVLHPFFINCRNVCPATTARMAMLRDSLASQGLLGDGVRLVSITVDPARDTIASLRRWADEHGGSPPGSWAFLRGNPPERVRSLVQDGFHLSAMMPEDAAGDDTRPGDTGTGVPGPDDEAAGDEAWSAGADTSTDGSKAGYQVIHGSRVLLVDGRGRVRGSYEILRPGAFAKLVQDTRRLASGGP